MSSQQNFDLISTLNAQAVTTNGTTTAVDLLNYINVGGRNMKAFVNVGTMSGTSPTLDVSIEENSTSGASGWTLISGADATQVTTSGYQTIHFRPTKQYVKAIYTVGGSSPSVTVSMAFLAELRVK